MKISNLLKAPGVLTVTFALATATLHTPVMADMVSTQTLIMQADLQMQRDDVRSFIARDDVRHALLGYGINAADVEARINNMTESELLQIQGKLDSLPAGANGAVGLILGVILIFVLLDLLGATNIFPGI